jgi:hypothetical protein
VAGLLAFPLFTHCPMMTMICMTKNHGVHADVHALLDEKLAGTLVGDKGNDMCLNRHMDNHAPYQDDLLMAKEVAVILRMHYQTFMHNYQGMHIPYIQVAGRIMFRRSAIETWLSQNTRMVSA